MGTSIKDGDGKVNVQSREHEYWQIKIELYVLHDDSYLNVSMSLY